MRLKDAQMRQGQESWNSGIWIKINLLLLQVSSVVPLNCLLLNPT